jgi:hypothetical protein
MAPSCAVLAEFAALAAGGRRTAEAWRGYDLVEARTSAMTKALPFTQASLRRAIRAAQSAGLRVVGIRPDRTVLTQPSSEITAPLELADDLEQDGERSKWADKLAWRRWT